MKNMNKNEKNYYLMFELLEELLEEQTLWFGDYLEFSGHSVFFKPESTF
jgi:hypothetical protein